MQDIHEECVILEEVICLETAAITDPEIRKQSAVVGCGGADKSGVTCIPKELWAQQYN